MRSHLNVCLIACLAYWGHAARADAQLVTDHERILKLPFDDSAYQTTESELKAIDSLIDGLKEIDSPDFGFVSTFAGTGFGPVAGATNVHVGIIGIDHGLMPYTNTNKLIEYGPKAISSLLRRLDDATKTKLVFCAGVSCDGMAYSNEVFTDAMNPFEKSIAVNQEQNADARHSGRKPATAHTATIGDVCFAILGRIVNRPYLAVRYEPSNCLIINSPTRNPEMVVKVRSIWQNDSPAKRLFQSLNFDDARNAPSSDANAAVRLLYYFPRESVPRFVDRLDAVTRTSFGKQRNERDAFSFISKLSNLDEAEISDAVARIIERLDSNTLAQDCANATFLSQHAGLVLLRLKRALLREFDPQSKASYTDKTWLSIAAKYYPDLAEDIFRKFLQSDREGADLLVINVLTELDNIPWAVQLLRPYLYDDRLTGDYYGPEYDLRQSRTCDLAARAIVNHAPGTTFYLEGKHEYLDRQIANIRAKLDGLPTIALPEEFAVDLDCLPLTAPDNVLEVAATYDSVSKDSTNDVLDAYDSHINVATGEITKLDSFDALKRFDFVRPRLPDRGIYFDGENKVLCEFDRSSLKILRSVPCPFTDGWKNARPLSIWCLEDVAVIGQNEAIIAATKDGAVHIFDLTSQKLETIWKDEYGHQASVVGVRGTRRCLVSDIGEMPMIWDQESKRMIPLEKLPNSNWREAFNEFGRREEDRQGELWDLEKHERVRFQLPRDVYIYHLQCDSSKLWCFCQLNDGRCYLFDLRTRTAVGLLDLPQPSSWTNFTITNDNRSLICTQNLTQWGPNFGEVKVAKTVFAIYSMSKLELAWQSANSPQSHQ